MHGSLRILATGPFACVQDLGRSGYACIGVGESGAADRGALRLANRLVGNPEDAAGIEVLMGGFAARAHEPTLIAITGAAGQATVNGRPVGMNAAVAVSAGAVLQLEAAQTGLRRYLSLRGGIDVAPVLGSRATDTFSGVGPAPLAPGTLLPIGVPHLPVPDIDVAAVAPPDADPVLTIPWLAVSTPSAPTATASLCGCAASGCAERSSATWPRRVWFAARCRSRRTASP
jgi:allophanate hydrolase subunit 2